MWTVQWARAVGGLPLGLERSDAFQGVRALKEGPDDGRGGAAGLGLKALEDGLGAGLQADDDAGLEHQASVVGVDEGAAAGGHDLPLAVGGLAKKGALPLPEGRFAIVLKDGGDGLTGVAGDPVVGIDGPPAERAGDGLPDAGLAGA